MNHSTKYAFILFAVSLTIKLGDLHGQTSPQSDWQIETKPRLQAIYQHGEFRAKRLQANWLKDSSGYTVRERDPESNKMVLAKYDVRTGERIALKSSDPKPNRSSFDSPDGKRLLEYRGRNLFVRDLESEHRTQLTKHSSDRNISYRDPKWSPDGKRILFIESDSTNVRMRNVLVPDDPSYPSVRQNRFARTGEVISALRIGVVDMKGGQPQWLSIEAPEEGYYLGQVDWAGNSDEILVEKLSRFRDKREVFLVSIKGEIQRIYEETNEAWAVGSHGINKGLNWIQGGKAFIIVSEKDGWRHAFLYSQEGEKLAVLTPGEYDIIDKAVVDEQGGWYYFYASPENGTQKYLYRVPLDGSGSLERVTPEDQPGTHTYNFSPDAKWAFHTYSRLDTPPIIELVELPKHRVTRVLENNKELRKKAKKLISRPTEFLKLDIGNDVSMDAWLIKPKDFDESKKYPVFVYVYGEPYSQTVLDRWGAAQIDFHRVIADLGYLVVSIDNRGTPSPKGAAWRRSVFGSLGPLSTEDQVAGLKQLGRMRSYVDLSRVAIWGWSGGSSNTLNAMFRKSDVYHVGIAVVPKPQPHLYNAWFQEIYMRTREVNAEGYERSAPINFAEGLNGKLLIITGSGETNTHIQIIEGLVDKLIKLGKPFDYMVYPNRNHGLREGPGSELHVRMLITRYLLEHLPPGPRSGISTK
ncbi:MAG: S9 family peptidase [Planctomycetes bacterium]|nr:S9 family peptidase [Planctomycetota bacterium]MCH9723654.1 S9 family peptidase [Planctomycetota bacterium]MCH9778472.1 S9 family peptidase [Planctomycetota bacterium]MCH9791463.1 S9 family peptidase [Planctomycetota bacterium]